MASHWRYRCPDCGSIQLKRRVHRCQAKEVVADKRFSTSNWTGNGFYCRECQTPHAKVYDAKRDQLVYPGAVKDGAIRRWKRTRVEA